VDQKEQERPGPEPRQLLERHGPHHTSATEHKYNTPLGATLGIDGCEKRIFERNESVTDSRSITIHQRGALFQGGKVLAMAATGHVVAWDTERPALGLAAVAALGLTSVLGPTLLWYAASQALAAGTMIVVMLAALQVWRARGSFWPLA
jgi:hypothetical protein